MLEVPIDLSRLYDDGDPDYRLWMECVVTRVYRTREQQNHKKG
jgi:hypothetical protein